MIAEKRKLFFSFLMITISIIIIMIIITMIIIIKCFPAHDELGTCRTSLVSLGLVCQHAIGRKRWQHQMQRLCGV